MRIRIPSINVIFPGPGLACLAALLLAACAAAPLKNQPPDVMREFKAYQRLEVFASTPPWTSSGIEVQEGDTIIVFASGSATTNPSKRKPEPPAGRLYYTIGNDLIPLSALYGGNEHLFPALASGKLKFTVRDWRSDGHYRDSWYKDNLGSYTVDVFVIEEEKESLLPSLLQQLAQANTDDALFAGQVRDFVENHSVYFRVAQTNQQISDTKKQLADVDSILGKTAPNTQPVQLQKGISEDNTAAGPPVQPTAQPKAGADKELTEAELRARYAQLLRRLDDLEAQKARIEAEGSQRERELLNRLEIAQKRPPVIFIGTPRDGMATEVERVELSGVIEDDRQVSSVELVLNGETLRRLSPRGLKPSAADAYHRAEFREGVLLAPGRNTLQVKVTDADGLEAVKSVTVTFTATGKNMWAVVIGIDRYENVPALQFAAEDARAFYDHLVDNMKIPKQNIRLLLNEDADLTQIRSALGTYLRRKAGKDDMVLIFYAGHGATEKDALSPDGDGLEKYILPYGADPRDLYATSLPMEEISKIFQRITSERLIFIADACYSGASGGRTIGFGGARLTLSDAFWDRIVRGKGRVILTASGPNEISMENEDLGHGVFTHYLLEGLGGKADMDGDGLITVDEIYGYVSKNVAAATGQSQHPVKKGTVEGQLIIGVVAPGSGG